MTSGNIWTIEITHNLSTEKNAANLLKVQNFIKSNNSISYSLISLVLVLISVLRLAFFPIKINVFSLT